MFDTLLSSLVLAAGVRDGSILDIAQSYEPLDLINRAIAYGIIFAGFLSVAFIFYGGITFILSGGDEGKIQQAVSTIRYAIIGLVVTMLAVVIVIMVGNAIGLNVVQYINLGEVFDIVSNFRLPGTEGVGGPVRSLE